MRKVFSITIITLFILSMSIFCFGQKKRTINSTEETSQFDTKFNSTQAFTEGRGVYLKWQMEVESNNLGFNVFRYEGFQKVKVNPSLIGGGLFRNSIENSFGLDYSFFDPTGNFRSTYIIESFDLEGKIVSSEYIYPIFVKDLTPIAGLSNDAMLAGATKENNLFEKTEPILPVDLAREVAQNALPPNLEKQKFIASQPGVKIGVTKEGIFRVSRADLQNAGFDVNQTSANWQLHVNGVEQAMILGANDSYIEFYGKGVDTIETGTQVYYLINGAQNGKRIKEVFRRRIAGNVVAGGFQTSTSKKDPKLYFSKLRNGPANNFFSDKIVNATGVNVEFDVKDIDYTFGKSRIKITVQGFTNLPHNVKVTLNGEELGNITGNNQELMTMDLLIPTSILIDGTNILHLKGVDGANATSIWDTLKVDYKKLYKTQEDQISFYTIPYRASNIKGFSSPNIRVFDLTFPDKPDLLTNLQITEDNGTFTVHLPANRSKQMLAIENAQLLQPSFLRQNNPSNLSSTNLNGEFIVIGYKDWMNEAQAWANYRVGQGFTTQVVNVEDIYDEFNYGRVSANAIKNFLNFAKNNWQTPPKYTLLIGDTTYDPRDYENRGNINYLPVQMIDTLYEETGSDEFMADFNEDGLAEIAMGRIPVKNAASVTVALNKVINFEQNVANGLDRGALFPSDFPNGYDFQGLNQRLANELPTGTPVVTVNRGDPDPRTTLLNELNSGKFLVNYSGHGAPAFWSAVAFFSINDVATMQNQDNLTLFSMLTCLNGYFLRTNGDSLSEVLLLQPNVGAVSVWASTGLTTPDVQEVMGKKYFQNFSDPNISRLGDSIMVAKQSLIGGRDVRLSWALIGDPLLKIK